jgi:UDP-GlcNAc:undecaprenyl-phosphate GlcNAc-1-phosphate transferase
MQVALLVLWGLGAAVLSFALTPVARRLAIWIGAVDQPSARKVHEIPTPRLGGLAVVTSAAVVSALALGRINQAQREGLWVGLAFGLLPILFVSVIDDIRRLAYGWKLAGHVGGAVVAASLGIVLTDPIHLFGAEIHIGVLAYPLSVVWLVCVTNAFNLIDGLDGLSAGLALISAVSLIPVFVVVHQAGAAVVVLTLAGAIAGFLPWNVHPAKVFLGDTGATAIGFTLACLSLRGGSTIYAGFATLLPVIVLGVPLTDALVSVVRRLLQQNGDGARHMFVADRDHLHHRLLALGLSQRRVVLILYGIGLSLAGLALLSVLLNTQEAGLLLGAMVVAAFVGVGRLGYEEFGIIRSGVVLRFYDAPVLRGSFFIVLVDIALVVCSVYAAIGLKYDDWGLIRHRQLAIAMASVLAPLTVIVLWLMSLYRGSWRVAGIYDILRIGLAILVATLAGFLVLRPVTGRTGPVSLFLVYALANVTAAAASRMSFRVLDLFRARASTAGVPTLIYGAGQGGAMALSEILARPDIGLRAVGFIDDSPSRHGRFVHGLPILGTVSDLEARIRERNAGAVVVSTCKVPDERIAEAAAACERTGARLVRMHVEFDEYVAPPVDSAGAPC